MSTRSSIFLISIPFTSWSIHAYHDHSGKERKRIYIDIGPGSYNSLVFRLWPPRWGSGK